MTTDEYFKREMAYQRNVAGIDRPAEQTNIERPEQGENDTPGLTDQELRSRNLAPRPRFNSVGRFVGVIRSASEAGILVLTRDQLAAIKAYTLAEANRRDLSRRHSRSKLRDEAIARETRKHIVAEMALGKPAEKVSAYKPEPSSDTFSTEALRMYTDLAAEAEKAAERVMIDALAYDEIWPALAEAFEVHVAALDDPKNAKRKFTRDELFAAIDAADQALYLLRSANLGYLPGEERSKKKAVVALERERGGIVNLSDYDDYLTGQITLPEVRCYASDVDFQDADFEVAK